MLGEEYSEEIEEWCLWIMDEHREDIRLDLVTDSEEEQKIRDLQGSKETNPGEHTKKRRKVASRTM